MTVDELSEWLHRHYYNCLQNDIARALGEKSFATWVTDNNKLEALFFKVVRESGFTKEKIKAITADVGWVIGEDYCEEEEQQ